MSLTVHTPASEIITSNEVRSPQTLTFSITGACNLVCEHCLVGAGEVTSAQHVPSLSLLRILDEFAELDGAGVRFTGGEPLCHPDWFQFIRYSRTKGFRTIALQTNGMLIENMHAEALRSIDFPGLAIQISLDGASAVTHDAVRGAGAFKGALQGIKRLIRAGLAAQISIFFTEMAHNLAELPELLTLAADMGIHSVTSGTLLCSGRAASSSLIKPPTPAQHQILLERYAEDPSFRELYKKIGTVAALEWLTATTPRMECCTFAENPYITPLGTMYPCLLCHNDEYSVTDVFTKGLTKALAESAPLWTSLLQISRSRIEALAECRDCPGKQLCHGGCMGRAWSCHGDLLSADDRCDVRRNIYLHRSVEKRSVA